MDLNKSGFLIVQKYKKIYDANAERFKLKKDFYGLPRIDKKHPNN